MKKLATIWDASHQRMIENKDHSIYVENIAKTLAPNSTICDLGGGSGADAIHLAETGHNVTVYDISPLALQTAKDKAVKLGLNIDTRQVDFGDSQFSLEQESFDHIYSRMSMHYFKREQMHNILRNIYRALRPNGRATLSLKSPEDLKEMKFLRKTAREIEPGVFVDKGQIKTRFDRNQLLDMLKEAGLPDGLYSVKEMTEDLSGRKDSTKSGNKLFVLNEIIIRKSENEK